MNIEATITAVQRALNITADGKAGPQTWGAISARLCPAPEAPTGGDDLVDARSEAAIATLLDPVKPYARALVRKAAAQGITIRVIGGTRTYAEQDALYAKGRTLPGRIVTNARGGYSNHNFGIAFDIGVFEGSDYLDDSPLYKVVGSLGMELGLDWGGSWKSFRDDPHFELRPDWAKDLSESDMLAELRERTASGRGLI